MLVYSTTSFSLSVPLRLSCLFLSLTPSPSVCLSLLLSVCLSLSLSLSLCLSVCLSPHLCAMLLSASTHEANMRKFPIRLILVMIYNNYNNQQQRIWLQPQIRVLLFLVSFSRKKSHTLSRVGVIFFSKYIRLHSY